MKRDHLTAAIVNRGKATELGPEEVHARNVLAITKRIHTKQRQLRQGLATIKRLKSELRFDRRELRAVLQRASAITADHLELAGKADAADRAIALSQQQQLESLDTLRQSARAAGVHLLPVDPADDTPEGGQR